jgi:Zn-dependent protease with chaperone function
MTIAFFLLGLLVEGAFGLWALEVLKQDRARPAFTPETAEKRKLEGLQALHWGAFLAKLGRFFACACFYGSLRVSGGPALPAALLLYALLTLIGGRAQFVVEKELRGIEVSQGEALWRSSRAVLGMLTLFAIYFAVYVVSLQGIHFFLGRTLNRWVLLGVSLPTSLFVALGVVYLLSPLLVRFMLSCRKVDDPELERRLASCFTRAGLRTPSFWILDMDRQKLHNAMVSGLKSGRGPLRPALFFTRSLLEQLTPAEFEAIILHEVSHIALKHMAKRLFASIGSVLLSIVPSFVFLVVSWSVLPEGMRFLAGAGGVLIALSIQGFALRWLVRRQELEADAHAVFSLGADPEAFASALTKITRMNDQPIERKDPSSYLNPAAAHPTTERRIDALRWQAEARKSGLHPEAEPSKDLPKAA